MPPEALERLIGKVFLEGIRENSKLSRPLKSPFLGFDFIFRVADANQFPGRRPGPTQKPVRLIFEIDNGSHECQVSRSDLVNQSGYFKQQFLENIGVTNFEPRCRLSYDPTVLGLFTQWLSNPQLPRVYSPTEYSDKIWTDHAVHAWYLAQELSAGVFEKYALSHFIQNCALAAFGPWKLIEERGPEDGSLSKFSRHWVAWNYHLAGSGACEYDGLNATKLAHLVTGETRDPRIYDLEHWYENCGDYVNSLCLHDPIYREQLALEAKTKKQTKPKEWGAESERRAQNLG
jgi:hypothetical protein